MVEYTFLGVLVVIVIACIYFLIKNGNEPDESNANVRYKQTSDLCRQLRENINERTKKD